MAQITGGKMGYGRTTKPADYESKRADAEFTFIVQEGEGWEEIADRARDAAVQKVNELLGIAASAPAKGRGQQKPKVTEPPAEAPAPENKPAVVEAPKSEPEPTAEDLMGAPEPPKEPAKEVTDSELLSEITRVNAKIKNPVAIRKLISEFVPAPKAARDIPQDKRPSFLEKLKVL